MTATLDTKIQYRSKGEEVIARALDQLMLPFEYEPDLFLRDGDKRYIWHPDFYLPRYQTVIEYFGIEQDPCYDQMTRRKKRVYAANAYHLIPVYPATLRMNYQAYISKNIRSGLTARIEDLDRRTGYRRKP